MKRTEKKKVLVLGATGAMGQYLIPYLAEAGHTVDAVSLDEKQSEWPNVRYITANAKDRTVLKQLLSAKYDGIVDFMIYPTKELSYYLPLLLDHTGDTFVTPVFNGSASLRDAAGQLIEEVCKSRRRGQTVDEAYMEGLFDKINSLYRLDQIGGQAGNISDAKKELGPLPGTAVTLLAVLAVAWVLIGAYWVRTKVKEKKKE